MQSRAVFLRSGLVPVNSKLATDECPICFDTLENPLALPCKHIFCKKCIETWLSQHNSCPKCRYECFPLSIPLPLRGPIDPVRMIQMSGTTLTLSGLTSGTWTYYSDDISWTTSGLERATETANAWMNLREDPRVAGPAVINTHRLGLDILAMGNLLRGHAAVTGRAYSRNQLRDWRLIAESLYRALVTVEANSRARNERTVDALILDRLLRVEIEASLQQAGVDAYSFLNTDDREAESPASDYASLVGYVVSRATKEQARLEQRRRAIREETSLFARVSMRLQDAFRE